MKKFVILLFWIFLLAGCTIMSPLNSLNRRNEKIIKDSKDQICKRLGFGNLAPGNKEMVIKDAVNLAMADGCLKNKEITNIYCESGYGEWYFFINAKDSNDVAICKVDVETDKVRKTFLYELNRGYRVPGEI